MFKNSSTGEDYQIAFTSYVRHYDPVKGKLRVESDDFTFLVEELKVDKSIKVDCKFTVKIKSKIVQGVDNFTIEWSHAKRPAKNDRAIQYYANMFSYF